MRPSAGAAPGRGGGWDGIDAAVQRVAALLRGGLPASRAWCIAAAEAAAPGPRKRRPGAGSGPAELRRIAERIVGGAATGVALAAADGPEWRVLAAAWRLAEASGAPLAPTLDRFSSALRALERVAERREVLLAGPRSTIRLVMSLPPVALLLGWLLGFDPLRAFAGPLGIAALVLGALLLVLGVRWAGALARGLAAADWVAGWEFELLAIGVSGGSPPQLAMRRVVDCADEVGAEWLRLEEFGRAGGAARAVAAAVALGTPLVPSLLGEAESRRDRARAELERAAERLGVRVLVPLGVCVLPAFILLGVVPVLLSVLAGTGF